MDDVPNAKRRGKSGGEKSCDSPSDQRGPRKVLGRVALIETSQSARDSLRQVLVLDEFHHQGIGALRFLKSVDDLNGFVHRQGTDLLAQSLAV